MNKIHKIVIVGPLPPPAGGMANQTKKLAEFLESEKLTVDIVQVNPKYRPAWVEKLPVIRAGFRLLQYFSSLKRQIAGADLVHIMANSGWSWHLFAAPAIVVANHLGKPIVLNYRGGYAADFFKSSWRWVNLTLKKVDRVIVPSTFLQEVFEQYHITADVVPNVLDQRLFNEQVKSASAPINEAPLFIVTRNLELIYDVATTINAFYQVWQKYPNAQLNIAGTGPELDNLKAQVNSLGLDEHVSFVGRLSPEQMAELYQRADVMLNASIVDNSPNSVIEALACGTPVVSTNVGGIPKLVSHEHDVLLVSPKESEKMAGFALALIERRELRDQLVQNGLNTVKKFHWHQVWQQLQLCYQNAQMRRENAK